MEANKFMARAMHDRVKWPVVEWVYELVHPPPFLWLYSHAGGIQNS